ncbi:MAG: glucokinase [Sphingomonadales bacterium]
MAKQLIVADLGGTNGRFAVATFRDGAPLPAIDQYTNFRCDRHGGVGEMLEQYIRALEGEAPKEAQLAIAGPTSDRDGRLTNLGWTVSAADLEKNLSLDRVSLLNDFAALANAMLYLGEDDRISLTEGRRAVQGCPVSIIGPGTGFGVAMAVPDDAGWRVVSTEGGHMSFSPKTPLERDLHHHLSKTIGHVSVEALLSGAGLRRIHEFLVSYGGSGDATLEPADITRAAQEGNMPSCTRAVQLFLSVLGSVAGDIALVHGARGGVNIGGGILPKMQGLLRQSDLVERFQDKGAMTPYLSQIPINIVVSRMSALVGAAMAHFHKS